MEDYEQKYNDLVERLYEVSRDEDWRDERFCAVIHHMFDEVVEAHKEPVTAYEFVADADKIVSWLVDYRYVLLGTCEWGDDIPNEHVIVKTYFQAYPKPFLTLCLTGLYVQTLELDTDVRKSLKEQIEKIKLKVIAPNVEQ